MQECTLELDIDLCLKIQRLADSLKMSFADCVVFLLDRFNQPSFLPAGSTNLAEANGRGGAANDE